MSSYADSSSETAETITPAGAVDYNFKGHVSAQGLDLTAASTSSPPNDNQVRWLRASDGAVIADIFAYESAGHFVELQSIAADGSSGHVVMRAKQSSDSRYGYVAVNTIGSGGAAATSISAATGYDGTVFSKTILRGDGLSDWLQLAATGNKKIDFGLAQAVWPGGQTRSNVLQIQHRLGVIPAAMIACPSSNNGLNSFPTVQAYGPTNSAFNVLAQAVDGQVPPAQSFANLYWIAIG